ncbi:hypothetical protein FISHEDRAFT_66353 [Fistulina hepatica ATCC 64428]|uniref:Wax synthase domain-containing protein n=1 Tax=Fistulina hepatica ATCC 64428 TaxID=1128425 RepID=A0A0D7A6M8_9AGAR|nr:hypothetical protein FISHEDRAFT_66353 [Fistulina hepatica ATCC 64428]
MASYDWMSIYDGACLAIRTPKPDPPKCIPATSPEILVPFICHVPFIYLAYLARRPNTYLMRLSLLPIALGGVVGSAFNLFPGLASEIMVARCLQYAFTKEGMVKIGEVAPGVTGTKDKNGPNGDARTPTRRPSWIPSGLYDALELLFNCRGIGWKFGEGVYVPKEDRPLERGAFLRSTFLRFVWNFFLLDVCETVVKLIPGIGSPSGGSIFLPYLPVVPRYVFALTLTFTVAGLIIVGFYLIYDLVTLIGVGLLGSDPASFPPLFDYPFSATSMHELWAKRWHQVVRSTFLVYGGNLGTFIGGNIGGVFGTFLASGLFHDISMFEMGGTVTFVPALFFTAQAPILMLELLWKRVTGKRVDGTWGWLWVLTCMAVCGQFVVSEWLEQGLGGKMIIPPPLGIVRLTVNYLIEQWLARSN